jgi:hypothetical protein
METSDDFLIENDFKGINDRYFDQIRFLLSFNRFLYFELKNCRNVIQVLELFKQKKLFDSCMFLDLFKELGLASLCEKHLKKLKNGNKLNKNYVQVNKIQQDLGLDDNSRIIFTLNNFKSATAKTICDFYLQSKFDGNSELIKGSIFYSKLLNSLKMNKKVLIYQKYAEFKYDDKIDAIFEEYFSPKLELEKSQVLSSKVYDYNESTKRGFCIILNIDKIQNQNPRKGSEYDVSNIKKTFESLNYEVKICTENTKIHILNFLEEVSKSFELENHDSFIMFLMSHGYVNCILDANEEKIFYEDIFEIFRANNCYRLIGKPKIFMIAACQIFENNTNNRRMLGISLNDNQMETDSFNNQKIDRKSIGKLCDSEKEKYFAELQDFLVYIAAINGTVSFRDDKGTYLVKNLIANIKKNDL